MVRRESKSGKSNFGCKVRINRESPDSLRSRGLPKNFTRAAKRLIAEPPPDEGKKKRGRPRVYKPIPNIDWDTADRVVGSDMENELRREFSLKQSGAKAIIQTLVKFIRKALIAGVPVTIPHLARLEPYARKGTNYRHPVTGELEEAEPRKHVRLILSTGLKKVLNDGSVVDG
jgi:nucleoid DNA-binding protein